MYTSHLTERISIIVIAISFISTHLCYQRINMSQYTLTKIIFGLFSLIFLLVFIESGTALWIKNIRQDYLQKGMMIFARCVQVGLITWGIRMCVVTVILQFRSRKDNKHINQSTAT